uniref:Uncharacterized protein n=1 Tax=Eptatretus burgeri TaxID=7764 RepID=A0A8C4R460_EPTBU
MYLPLPYLLSESKASRTVKLADVKMNYNSKIPHRYITPLQSLHVPLSSNYTHKSQVIIFYILIIQTLCCFTSKGCLSSSCKPNLF